MTFSALDSQVVDALLKLGTATIYEAQGAYGAIDCKIKPLDRHMKVAGRVFTLHMRPGDNLMIHYALLHIKRGDVLVINCDGFEEAGIWGMSLRHKPSMQELRDLSLTVRLEIAKLLSTLVFLFFLVQFLSEVLKRNSLVS